MRFKFKEECVIPPELNPKLDKKRAWVPVDRRHGVVSGPPKEAQNVHVTSTINHI